MHSRREQFGEAITKLKRLGEHPRTVQLDPLRERVEQLDHELTTVTDPDEHYTLSKLSQEANTLLSKAYERLEIDLNVARAAHDREIHDALHPTILSPHSALAHWGELDRPGPWDGFDR